MDGLLAQAFTAAVGIAVGVAGNFIFAHMRIWLSHRKLRVCGTWGEKLSDLPGRQFSHAEIYFDRVEDRFCFDGTNFFNDGRRHSRWQTIASALEYEQKRLYYIFAPYVEGDVGPVSYGFGVVNLARKGRYFVPIDGYFVSPSVEGNPCVHTMVPVPMRYDPTATGNELIKFMNGQSGNGVAESAPRLSSEIRQNIPE